jgi:RNA polymerase sigma-70 factor (ECF subfamily)
MLRSCQGDNQAYYQLVQRWQGRLVNFFYRQVQQHQTAEDLAQDVLVSLWKVKHYETRAQFSTWIYRIARNRLIDYLRRPATPQQIEDHELERVIGASHETPENQLILREEQQRLWAALAQLPEKQRTLVILGKYQELDHAHIAEVVQCSKNSVKVLLFRAMSNLAKIFKEMSPP